MADQITPRDRLFRVEGKLDQLITSTTEGQKAAAESRLRIYRKIDMIDEKVDGVSREQANIERRLSQLEDTQSRRVLPAIERGERLQHRFEGAAWTHGHYWRAVKWVAGLVGVALVTFWRELLQLLRGG